MVEVFAPGNSLADTEWDGHVSAVIRVNRDVLTRSAITGLWRSTSETALFVSDVVLPAAQCAKAIRDHWSIENRSHYVCDGSFAEDASRIRCNPGIFARLRSSLRHYLIVWADKPQIAHQRRGDDGAIETHAVMGGEMRLEPPGITIRVEDIYAT